MLTNRLRSNLIQTVVLTTLWGCGGEHGIHRLLFVSKADQQRQDVRTQKAQVAFDSSDYTTALALTTEVLSQNPFHRKAVLLKASSELALAQLSVFDILRRISSESSSSTALQSSESADLLTGLSETLLQLGAADYEQLGTFSDPSSNRFFGNIPVLIPGVPGDYTREGSVRQSYPPLRYLNASIHTLCPYIPAALRAQGPDNPRYQCEEVDATSTQAFFLFFLTHLTEALMFHSALLYSGDTGSGSVALHPGALSLNSDAQSQTGLFKRLTALQSASTSDLSLDEVIEYSDAVSSLTTDFKTIFDLSPGTMLSELMLDIRLAGDAVALIAGAPESVTKDLSAVLTQVEQTATQGSEELSGLGTQTSSLKKALSGAAASKLNDQMEIFFDKLTEAKAESGGELTLCQVAKIKQTCTLTSQLFSEFDNLTSQNECATYMSQDTGDIDPKTCGS